MFKGEFYGMWITSQQACDQKEIGKFGVCKRAEQLFIYQAVLSFPEKFPRNQEKGPSEKGSYVTSLPYIACGPLP